MEIGELILAALFAILALDAYRSNRRMDLSWAQAKAEYDRMMVRLTRTPYDDLRGARMAGPANWITSTATYWGPMLSTSMRPIEIGPEVWPVPLGVER